MATRPENRPKHFRSRRSATRPNRSIPLSTVATAALGFIALLIVIWFLWPLLRGNDLATQPTQPSDQALLVTLTPSAETLPGLETNASSPTSVAVIPSATPGVPQPAVPARIEANTYAKVAGTDSAGLRFRSGPGSDYITWRILPEGEIIKITGGPEEANEVIWWRAVDRSGLVGWVAERWLVPVAPPAWTPEPERTPLPEELFTPTPTPTTESGA